MRRLEDETGASAVEYGLIVFAIAALIAVAVFGFGKIASATFTDSCATIQSEIDRSATC